MTAMNSPITTHVLDTMSGRPAAGVSVLLEVESGSGWKKLATGTTNADGRITDLVRKGSLGPRIYRLTFDTGSYFRSAGIQSFYPFVIVTFEVKEPSTHYHVPLLLSPYGYSTYRGS